MHILKTRNLLANKYVVYWNLLFDLLLANCCAEPVRLIVVDISQ